MFLWRNSISYRMPPCIEQFCHGKGGGKLLQRLTWNTKLLIFSNGQQTGLPVASANITSGLHNDKICCYQSGFCSNTWLQQLIGALRNVNLIPGRRCACTTRRERARCLRQWRSIARAESWARRDSCGWREVLAAGRSWVFQITVF